MTSSTQYPPSTAASPATPRLALADPAIEGLYATVPRPLSFAPGTHTRAFLLRRPEGNLLIYSVDGLAEAAPAVAELGGASRQYLNHGHEAMFSADRLDLPVFVHEADAAMARDAFDVRATFSRRHRVGGDFEAIPIPGHTPGATAYLWEGGGRRLLFTGDSLLLSGAEWTVAVLGSSDRGAYVESLELLREIDFDVLVPWAASAGRSPVAFTDGADARRRIDAILARLRRGERR